MSDTEHNKGKLVPVPKFGTLEDTAKKILYDNGETEQGCYDSYLEHLEDWGYRKYHITEDAIYKVENKEVDCDEDVFTASAEEGGVIRYETKFYNGGCSFSEALDSAISKIDKEGS
ncbi:hypothetical protein KAR91_85120 [Candidatus Pacearchaeota archaeon]|nr:hypothetical protein [Candidatus Pacearchaeota archaeon]